ncbi:MAG: prepilin-type N-terminal cleavage/methylation domain-containing protein [Thermoanaerobaculum sp.]|nr:prepilin-type N-terminal cleavage/methylation domain-containing protein [Thermoanaerobaculum sp.]MCX7895617.1 prepilin-type N-terminal cleavage/methylation domain-containing protein [Thermoanaerobaculum sp.]MDW7967188.1 prepilin-type N-terminal cleavage/methylation domain-containing protein [Thermoanaerobaculum sp.]
MKTQRGSSLLEVLVVMALVALMVAVALPAWDRPLARAGLAQGAYRIVSDLQRCPSLAAQYLSKVALVFDVDARGRFYVLVRDGNGNGVSRKEYLTGRDPVLGGKVYLRDVAPQVRLGPPVGLRVPQPGGEGWVPQEGLSVGQAGLLSFSPGFGATPGSIYLSSGSRVAAVRVSPSGAVRLLTWDQLRREWVAFSF